MKKFELCYELDKGRVLVPDLLPVAEPAVPEPEGEVLHFAVTYHFLPRAIMPRLIVNLHANIEDELRWRKGVALKHPHFQARAVLRVDYVDSRLTVAVSGQQRRTYFAVVLHCLRAIHASFEKIGAREHIRCSCVVCRESQTPNEYNYDALIRYKNKGIEHIPCAEAAEMVAVDDLLAGTFGAPLQGGEAILDELRQLREQLKDNESGADVAKKILQVKPAVAGISLDVGELIHRIFK